MSRLHIPDVANASQIRRLAAPSFNTREIRGSSVRFHLVTMARVRGAVSRGGRQRKPPAKGAPSTSRSRLAEPSPDPTPSPESSPEPANSSDPKSEGRNPTPTRKKTLSVATVLIRSPELDPDHFCAKDVGSASDKCTQCTKPRKGTKGGGCVPLDIDKLACRNEYNVFTMARTQARRTRDNKTLRAFKKASKSLRKAVKNPLSRADRASKAARQNEDASETPRQNEDASSIVNGEGSDGDDREGSGSESEGEEEGSS
ncbi:hypothetical protein CHU98_g11719 [Xylaria longipes]|nr:hypothetical protein CHU98_g11719 [Xylaria longipes]